MAVNGKQIAGIGIAVGLVTCLATDVIVRNAKKFRKLRASNKKESEEKK